MLIDRIRKLIGRREVPREARDLLRESNDARTILRGLDELITRNEMEVNSINREIEALEQVECDEVERIRGGELPERSKNNVLRRIQRLRKQMDNLEERQQIYNRNISLQIHLVGRIQALEAMEMRGVDETVIDSIVSDYEQELCNYQDALDSEELMVGDLGNALDDRSVLADLEQEILGQGQGATEESGSVDPPAPASPSVSDSAAKEAQQGGPAKETVEDLRTDDSARATEAAERDGADAADRVGTAGDGSEASAVMIPAHDDSGSEVER